MNPARKTRPDFDTTRRGDLGPVPGPEDFANILRLRPQIQPAVAEPRERMATTVTEQDISSALDLVRQAAASIRDADERVRDSQSRTQALLQRAVEELKSAEARAERAEALTRAAETRAREAQARAEEAENWLRQVFATISEELPARH
ncbi:hypothetical protein [Enterovirga sp.]|uniref:hypothetical protein n=1 Tax=Enterovirga sp. TaxID=2026350 RepID=UPI002CA36845|nr:hypothetical protein [Enterovirga sp.]HMO31315.1 hypothetical protein [Enterovirga sp.]